MGNSMTPKTLIAPVIGGFDPMAAVQAILMAKSA
jgi:hypothetical protein